MCVSVHVSAWVTEFRGQSVGVGIHLSLSGSRRLDSVLEGLVDSAFSK